MLHRAFRILLLAFVVVWFGIILPGHRRGELSFNSWQKTCCNVAYKSAAPVKDIPAPKSSCAICHFIAMLDQPGPMQNDAPELTAAPGFFSFTPKVLFLIQFHSTCLERGPPIA